MTFRCLSHVNKLQRERVKTSMLGTVERDLSIVTGMVYWFEDGGWIAAIQD